MSRLLRWWDETAVTDRALYVALHLGALAAPFVALNTTVLTVFAVTFGVRMFGVSVGYHRYFAHRSFRTSRAFQLILAVLGTSSLQRGVLWWAQTHREHHRHADTPEDLHSPTLQGFWYSHWGWFFRPEHKTTRMEGVRDLTRYPELVWLDQTPARAVVAAAYGIGLQQLFGWGGFFWGFFVSTLLCSHLVHWIQSFAHCWGGYRNFESKDLSRNHWTVGLLTLGEYHNNHHWRPSSARQSARWFEIDVGWGVLRVLERLGLVWDVRDAFHGVQSEEPNA